MLISREYINTIMHNKYVLASSSKSRYNILKNCGFNFIQKKPNCNEESIKAKLKKNQRPTAVAKKLSFEKAKSISTTKKFFNHYVIGCDTLISMNNTIFDKAKNINEAKSKIKKLSGKTHKIISGITICRKGSVVWQSSETTYVKIRKLKPSDIKKYLNETGKQILTSVGCYQIELLGPHIIEDIRGDFFNVMGLPLFKLLKYVKENK